MSIIITIQRHFYRFFLDKLIMPIDMGNEFSWSFASALLLRNNYTKAAVPMLSKFSKHRSTSSSKLFMKRWHCIFNTIVKKVP